MGTRIVEYAQKRRTDKPLVVIVGEKHARKSSGLYAPLREAGLSYRPVHQRHLDYEPGVDEIMHLSKLLRRK